MPRRLGTALGLISILALLLGVGTAGAATSTIGQLAPDSYTSVAGPPPYYYPEYTYHPPAAAAPCTTAQDYLQAGVSSGTAYVVPAKGEKITAWRTNATTGAGQKMTLKVFRKVGATTEYEVVAHDGPRDLNAAPSTNERGKVNSFAGLSIPVQAGDVVGLYPAAGSTACMFAAGGTYMASGTNLGDGTSGPFTPVSDYRLNLTADVLLEATTGGGGGPTQHTLTASLAGSGAGTVQSSPAGIESCASTCSHAFDDTTMVTLTASPDSYSTFSGWSGGGCSGKSTCQVTIAADTSVTATFDVAAGGNYGYEYPSGNYGTPGGENGSGNPTVATRKCRKQASSKGHKAHCVKKTRVVAKRAHNANLGKEILTTKKGRTLYSLSAEGGKNFICTAGCLSVWHPLTVPKGVRPTGPVNLGVVTRPEGGVQVTYRGRPLYTFSGDTAAGDTNGEGIKDVGTWGAVVVSPPKH